MTVRLMSDRELRRLEVVQDLDRRRLTTAPGAISTTRVSLRSVELFYEPSGPSPLGNTGSGFERPYSGRRSGAALRRGLRARPPPESNQSDISKWQKQ